LAYLKAMQIDVWQRRALPAAVLDASEERLLAGSPNVAQAPVAASAPAVSDAHAAAALQSGQASAAASLEIPAHSSVAAPGMQSGASGGAGIGQQRSAPPSAEPTQPQAQSSLLASVSLADDGAVTPGMAVAEMGWTALEAAVRDCTRCPLHAT